MGMPHPGVERIPTCPAHVGGSALDQERGQSPPTMLRRRHQIDQYGFILRKAPKQRVLKAVRPPKPANRHQAAIEEQPIAVCVVTAVTKSIPKFGARN